MYLVLVVCFLAFVVLACSDDKKDDEQNEVKEYTVTFVVDGNETKEKVAEGEKAVKPADPVKDGYEFIGWYLGDEEYTFNKVTSNITVVAKFNKVIKEYTVTFIVGEEKTTLTVKEGESVTKPADPVKEGFTFIGWYLGEEEYTFDKVTSNITVVAKFNKVIKEYTVTFIVGEEKTTLTVKEGESITKPADPVKEGFTFIGWYQADTLYNFEALVTADVTIVAKFEEIVYTVNFVVDDSEETVTVKEGEKAVKPDDPLKDGYVFLGWFIGEELFDFNTPVTSDLELIGKFEVFIKKYTVTITVDGVSEIQIVEQGEVPIKPQDPVKEGFIFDGWYVNKKEYDFGPVYQDMIIYAKFDYIFTYPEPLTSDEELMIKQIYLDELPKNEYNSFTIDDIDITYYFGNYDGAYVVNINNERGWCSVMNVHEHYVSAVKEEYVSYGSFTFQCSWHTIMVIKDGVLYNIEYIMLLHIIRYEDMLNIYGLYEDMILNKDKE